MRLRRRTEGARALAPGAAAVLVLALLVVAGLAAPAGATVTAQQVEQAREELREVSARLEGEVARYEAALLEEEDLRERISRIRLELTEREQSRS
ncbi:MAG: hypothetical protein H6Q11_1478 [Acidobacteria bacterium]|nr:hypothetical protein [Acidobacteriota bacterium]